MACTFVNTLSQYISANVAPVTGAPLTLFAIVNPSPAWVTGQAIISIGASGTGTHRFQTAHSNVGNPANREVAYQAISAVVADAQGPAYSVAASAWNPVTGVERSSTDREVYVGSTSKATNTISSVPLGINALYIAARNNNGIGGFGYEDLAEAAIWNVALTDAEIASLAKGFSPRRIRPQSLVFYAPLVRAAIDVRKGITLNPVNSPTVANHPRVY